jgi:hypothetical protein
MTHHKKGKSGRAHRNPKTVSLGDPYRIFGNGKNGSKDKEFVARKRFKKNVRIDPETV